MSDIDRGTDRAGRRKKRFLALGRARQVRIARPDRCARTGGVNGGAPGTEVVPPGMRLVRSTSVIPHVGVHRMFGTADERSWLAPTESNRARARRGLVVCRSAWQEPDGDIPR